MTYEKGITKYLVGVALIAVVLANTGCNQPPPPEDQVQIRGKVLDLANDAPIAGALVQAVDINGTPVGATAETDAQGNYELAVPQLWDPDNIQGETPEEEVQLDPGVYMLRCQAKGYQEFPSAIRPSLPIDMATAIDNSAKAGLFGIKRLIDETVTTLTTIKLISLGGNPSSLGSISGNIVLVRSSASYAGVLIVAVNEATDEAYTGFSGSQGEFVIFNLPAGAYRVEGYAQGMQFVPESGVAVAAGEQRTGVNLTESTNPLSTVSGTVQIVDAPGGAMTSVVLAVASTFNEAAGRGVVPPGLRVGDVTSAFVIENVPDGRYAVLAAFENDDLVRDPDQSIGGTQIVYIDVPGPGGENNIVIQEGFKVTEALAVFGPGADTPEAVTTPTPTLEWADDSSEDGYEIWVIDSFGNDMWSTEIVGVSGLETVSVLYEGLPLKDGMYYQFRVLSFREKQGNRTAISITEDLKGVFYYQAAE